MRMLNATLHITNFSVKSIATILTVACFMATAPAIAQDRELRRLSEEVDDLGDQLRSITRYLSNNEDAPRDYTGGNTVGSSNVDMANVEVRLSGLENQLRSMTGLIEEMQHQVQQSSQRMERLAEDYEYRLQQLERGGSAGAATSTTAIPAPTSTTIATETPTPTAPSDTATDVAVMPTGDPTALYNAALSLLRQENYTRAADEFQVFLTSYPSHDLAANAQYWLGEAYYARRSYSEAARAFLTAYQDYPDSAKASGALLKLGISLGELDQTQDACAALREFDTRYPNASPIERNRAADARKELNCP